jgi:hypothetical protein
MPGAPFTPVQTNKSLRAATRIRTRPTITSCTHALEKHSPSEAPPIDNRADGASEVIELLAWISPEGSDAEKKA